MNEYALDWKVLPYEFIFEKWMSVTNYEIQYHPLKINYEIFVEMYVFWNFFKNFLEFTL